MTQRGDLKQYFDEKEVQSELQGIISQIQNLQPEAQEIITTYCIQWFQSFFDSQCEVEDFLGEIKKLEEPECEQKLLEFIKKKISQMESKAKKPKEENNTSAKASTIHDRIKPKGNTAASSVKNQDTPQSNQPTTKKFVKILEKDEQKLKKANEAVENKNSANSNQNNNTSNTNNTEENDESLIKELEDKKKQRCKYYPNCKNERTCPYIHPTEPCSFFPSCKYGSQCINKHPDCKYGKSCQRPDCFYEHPFPKKPNMNPFLQMLMMPMMNATKRKITNKPNGKRPFPGNNPGQQQGSDEQKTEEKQQQP
ncbi:hypothetical protein ABPG72_017165 [Tetrahymena utriculariae]